MPLPLMSLNTVPEIDACCTVPEIVEISGKRELSDGGKGGASASNNKLAIALPRCAGSDRLGCLVGRNQCTREREPQRRICGQNKIANGLHRNSGAEQDCLSIDSTGVCADASGAAIWRKDCV